MTGWDAAQTNRKNSQWMLWFRRSYASIWSFRDGTHRAAGSRAVGISFRYRPCALVPCQARCKIPNDRIEMAVECITSRKPLVARMKQHESAAPCSVLTEIVFVCRQWLPGKGEGKGEGKEGRREARPDAPQAGVIALTDVPLAAVEAYDAAVFPAPRTAFLRAWIGSPGHVGCRAR
jgi:hypothetical protein